MTTLAKNTNIIEEDEEKIGHVKMETSQLMSTKTGNDGNFVQSTEKGCTGNVALSFADAMRAEFAKRERPSSIDLTHSIKENQNDTQQKLPPPSQHSSLLSYSMLRKEAKKLSLSRGINLPSIQLNDIALSTSSSIGSGDTMRKGGKGHRRGRSLGDFCSTNDQGNQNTSIGSNNSRNGSGDENSNQNSDEIGNATGSDISPASIISPIGHTLKYCSDYTKEHDLNRTTHSESFCIVVDQLNDTKPCDIQPTSSMESPTVDIRIFYANGTAIQFCVENGLEASAEDLLQLMAEHLGIDDLSMADEALAIWLVSPLLELQLKPHHIPYEICRKWPAFLRRFTTSDEDDILLDEPLLVLRRNVLLTLEREIRFVKQYERLAEVLYLHARDEFLSGRYPVSIETTLELVGLQLVIEFGPYNGRVEEALNLINESLHEIAPLPHCKAIRSFHLFGLRMMECKKGLEDRVVDEYKTATEHYHNNAERRNAFLAILRRTPYYGAAFFPGTIEKSKLAEIAGEVNVGVGTSTFTDFADGSLANVESQYNGYQKRKRRPSPSQAKLIRAIVSPSNFFGRLRRMCHYRWGLNGHGLQNGHFGQPNGHHPQMQNGTNGKLLAGRREILIGINHASITLLDPREYKVFEVINDTSPEGNMSLNEKISLFCAADKFVK